MAVKDELLQQIDRLLEEGRRILATFRVAQDFYERGVYVSNLPEHELRTFATSAFACLARIAGPESEYYRHVPTVDLGENLAFPGLKFCKTIPGLIGSLASLREAVDAGLLISLEARLRANIHDDFLHQAKQLLDDKYHVAAMVLIGGVLEDHLRKLCANNGLTCPGSGSLSKYNELLRDNVYQQPVWRRIQALGDVRNDAAHGHWEKVKAEDVQEHLAYTERLLTDYPA